MKRPVSAVVAAMVPLALLACSSDGSGTATTITIPSTDAAGDAIDMSAVETFPGLPNGHTTAAVEYAQSPPVGGDHNPAWQNCGVYDTPVRNEHAVHSLEHGAVWLAYDPALDAPDVATLAALARNQSHILVSPYPGLAAGEAVVASAWGVQLRLAAVDDPRLAAFIAAYLVGPQAPEPGVTCSGGVGEPIA